MHRKPIYCISAPLETESFSTNLSWMPSWIPQIVFAYTCQNSGLYTRNVSNCQINLRNSLNVFIFCRHSNCNPNSLHKAWSKMFVYIWEVWWLSSLFFLPFTDVFCYPPQIPAWCQEPLLVWGVHWEYHFGPVQDKLVCALFEALPDRVSTLEEHFPRTLVSPRRETLPHAVPPLFLYHWPTKVWHNGPVWQTETAPRRQVHHFQRATLVDAQEVWWVQKTIICHGRGLKAGTQ